MTDWLLAIIAIVCFGGSMAIAAELHELMEEVKRIREVLGK